MKRKKQNKTITIQKIKHIFWLVLGFAIIGFFIYKVARNVYTDHVLEHNAQHVKAVIIDKRNYLPNQPVKPEFSYSYQFVVNGEKYTGNAHDITLKVGDSCVVLYNKNCPGLNKPLNPKE